MTCVENAWGKQQCHSHTVGHGICTTTGLKKMIKHLSHAVSHGVKYSQTGWEITAMSCSHPVNYLLGLLGKRLQNSLQAVYPV